MGVVVAAAGGGGGGCDGVEGGGVSRSFCWSRRRFSNLFLSHGAFYRLEKKINFTPSTQNIINNTFFY